MKAKSILAQFETVNPIQEGLSQHGPWKSITFTVRFIDDDDDAETPLHMLLRARGRLAQCIHYLWEEKQLNGVYRFDISFGTHTFLASDNALHTINDILCLHFEKEE